MDKSCNFQFIRDIPTPRYGQYPHENPISGLEEKLAFPVDILWMDFSRFFPQRELVPGMEPDPTFGAKRKNHPTYGTLEDLSTVSTVPTTVTILISYLNTMLELIL